MPQSEFGLLPLALEAALEHDELVLFYQPQITSDGKTLAGVEALVRWDHPTLGRIGPDSFIPMAEKCDLIEQLGEWVLIQSCKDAARWPGVGVSVNVSPLQFRRPNFVEEVQAIVSASGVPVGQIELEIVETAYFEDVDRAEAALRALRAFGLKIALDDFGTGYSSLSYLRRLPFDKLKIDKSFVADIGGVQSAAIVHAVIALARAIGLKVTAEGVETQEQQRFLRAAGCHYLQGYLFSRPVPAEEIDAMLARYNEKRQAERPDARSGARGIL